MTLHEITSLLKNPSVSELALVSKAYIFAEQAHREHIRYSGEPYFNHLCETAKLIAELGADASTVAAGFLHDTIEDVNVKPETIRKEFGSEVLMLVEGVTKLGRLRYRGVDRYSESMRRLFIASSKDLRVLIIKLCDRLHNMRTLSYVPKHKQLRIAKETLDIYAPIAHRLGIRKINRELEELSFPYAYPAEYERVNAELSQKRTELIKKLSKFHKSVLKDLVKQGIQVLFTEERLKGLYSLYYKLKQRDGDFEKIYDVLAIRIIVKTVEDCYRVLGVIHASWRPLPGRIKDYVAFPKPNGYRSLHTTVFTGDGGIVEIQIRTEEMHRESEYGVALHADYKEEERPAKRGRKRRLYSSLISWKGKRDKGDGKTVLNIEDTGNGIPSWVRALGALDRTIGEQEFWEHLREDFFKDRIFIFTPKGDVVDLPTDSSPIDFAYSIHSDIGNHLMGAKINGKLLPIHTTLQNGDIVEILTKKGGKPTQKWLEFARTSIAKKHIRNTLQKLKP
ncbi:MAG: bifunctional (p)ppGpp synthetase/guanosine-3',5'-bis(diphosphate) 3'-pyrophosphohydrolase [Candidatus Taylorbacteria bacterium]|nr:bifunctional (p)ppGpp synthetase/guanosine-3',5'-bis(diphosphate) 3'-pyrophosphohydrolase [Candidatus Taylorbacteria bacterium]